MAAHGRISMYPEVENQLRTDKRLVYVIWTNKGGVGKTTLSFHIATTFAEHKIKEGWKVLVCDLCPQANISMTMLTPQKARKSPNDNDPGEAEAHVEGAGNVEKLCRKRLKPDYEIYCTVAGYIQSFVSRKAAAKVPPKDFLIQPCEYNKAIPKNMYLLCGDPALGVSCERLEQYRRADPGGDGEEPWRESTLALREFVDKACDGVDPDANWLVIIDTNPALTTYTQLALVAADQIIMPVNADDFSKVAVKALFELLYSTGEEDQRFSLIRKLTFAYKVKEYNVPLPRVRLVVNNRRTIYRTRACDAFSHMGDMIGGTLFDLFKKHPDRFVGGEEILMMLEDRSADDQGDSFRAVYTADLKDFHSTGVVCTHMGVPISVIAHGYYTKLEAFKSVTKTNGESCRKSVETLCDQMLKAPAQDLPATGSSRQPRGGPGQRGGQKKRRAPNPKPPPGRQKKSKKLTAAQADNNPTTSQPTAVSPTESGDQETALSPTVHHPTCKEFTRASLSRQLKKDVSGQQSAKSTSATSAQALVESCEIHRTLTAVDAKGTTHASVSTPNWQLPNKCSDSAGLLTASIAVTTTSLSLLSGEQEHAARPVAHQQGQLLSRSELPPFP